MKLSDGQELAMVACAFGEILYLYWLAYEVNDQLARQGQPPVTKARYGWRFFNQVLSEHERLFPNSSKRSCWVLSWVLLALFFILVDLF